MTATNEARYAGADATVVRRGRTTVVLSDGGAARAVWDGVSADSPVTAVLDALAGLPGTSLTTLPPFAAVTLTDDGDAHVLVRGRFQAVLATAAGDVVVDGGDVATWHERRVADVATVALGTRPRGAADLLADRDAWPLVEGVVRADEVALEVVPGVARASTGPAGLAGAPVRSRPTPSPAWPLPGAASRPVLSVPEVETVLPGAQPEPVAPSARHATDVPPAPPAPGTPPAPPAPGPAAPPAPEAKPPAADPIDAPPAPEATQAGPVDIADDGYAHLWGATVMRTVEDAAVRPDEDDEAHEADAPPQPPQAATPVPAPAPPAPAAPAAPEAGGLIAGVPRSWASGPAAETPAPAAPVPADPAPPAPAPAPQGGSEEIDHDGHTIMSSALADLRSGAAAPAPEPSAPAPAPGAGPQVLANLCTHGHANPPSRGECRTCGAPLEGEADLAPRPVLGRVRVAGGPVVDLDRPLVVGRRPRTPRSTAGEMPRLVTVTSPNQDVSRSHVEVRLEGWHVLVTDLATTNGTVLHRDGQSPQRLHPGEPTLVVDGDVVDLGDGATLTFEEIW